MGFFPDFELPGAEPNCPRGHYHSLQKWVFEAMNATSGVNQDCIAAMPEQERYMCYFADQVVPFVRTPLFVLQSQYDSWTSKNEFGSKLTQPGPAEIQQQGFLVSALVRSRLLA